MNRDLRGQIDFYNQRWHDFTYANAYKMNRCAAILEAISDTNLVEPRILDLGCGAGWLSAILGMFGPTVGVDLSESAIQAAQIRFPHVQYIQANVFEWQVPKEAFDIVVSQEVIEHVDNQMGYLQIAQEALRPNGFLILTTPNKSTMLAMTNEQRDNWSNQPIENWLTVNEIKKQVAQSYKIIRVHTIIPGVGHRGLYRLFNSTRLENLMEQMGSEWIFDRLKLALGLGLHTVVVARKLV